MNYDNDIALIKISPKDGRGIMAGVYIQPACLPNENTDYTEDLDCYISGWGKTSLGAFYTLVRHRTRRHNAKTLMMIYYVLAN